MSAWLEAPTISALYVLLILFLLLLIPKMRRYFIVYPMAMMEKFDCRPSSQMCISIVSSRLKTFAISQIAYLLLPIIIVVVPCTNNTNIRQNTSIPPCCDGYIIIRVVHTNVKPSFTGACNHPPTRNDLSCKQTKYISYPQYSTSENQKNMQILQIVRTLLALLWTQRARPPAPARSQRCCYFENLFVLFGHYSYKKNYKYKYKSFRCRS